MSAHPFHERPFLMKKCAVLSILALLFLAGCACPAPKNGDEAHLTLGTFKGVLRSSQGKGTETELTLNLRGPGWAEGDYILKETPVGKNNKTVITRGEWTTLRGTPKDDDAVVYQLEPDHYERSKCYLKVSEKEIRPLDRDQNEIRSSVPLTLRRSK